MLAAPFDGIVSLNVRRVWQPTVDTCIVRFRSASQLVAYLIARPARRRSRPQMIHLMRASACMLCMLGGAGLSCAQHIIESADPSCLHCKDTVLSRG